MEFDCLTNVGHGFPTLLTPFVDIEHDIYHGQCVTWFTGFQYTLLRNGFSDLRTPAEIRL